mmetsp:Transcript_21494/g.83364  ORF Transcript_21494/g.83364 Transcript_21494/m.83364 type:complete len:377 (-) Transcript_21494:1869-2999(-)
MRRRAAGRRPGQGAGAPAGHARRAARRRAPAEAGAARGRARRRRAPGDRQQGAPLAAHARRPLGGRRALERSGQRARPLRVAGRAQGLRGPVRGHAHRRACRRQHRAARRIPLLGPRRRRRGAGARARGARAGDRRHLLTVRRRPPGPLCNGAQGAARPRPVAARLGHARGGQGRAALLLLAGGRLPAPGQGHAASAAARAAGRQCADPGPGQAPLLAALAALLRAGGAQVAAALHAQRPLHGRLPRAARPRLVQVPQRPPLLGGRVHHAHAAGPLPGVRRADRRPEPRLGQGCEPHRRQERRERARAARLHPQNAGRALGPPLGPHGAPLPLPHPQRNGHRPRRGGSGHERRRGRGGAAGARVGAGGGQGGGPHL